MGRAAWAFTLFVTLVIFQGFHELEHVAKIVEYIQLGHRNGTGGILGIGPGALRPTFNLVLLHFSYNTLAYTPALLAFLRLGFHHPILDGLAARRMAWSQARASRASDG